MNMDSNTAIILLGHGSRVKDASKPMERLAQALEGRLNPGKVYVCYMSRLGPHYPEVFQKALDEGAKQVLVIPYFLHEGLHIRLDIPQMLQEEAAKAPEVRVVLGKNLGYDESLVELVEKRCNEAIDFNDIRSVPLPDSDSFPLPEGQSEFIAVDEQTAKKLRRMGLVNH